MPMDDVADAGEVHERECARPPEWKTRLCTSPRHVRAVGVGSSCRRPRLRVRMCLTPSTTA